MLQQYLKILRAGSREAEGVDEVRDEQAGEALARLVSGDEQYLRGVTGAARITPEVRRETAAHGQHPYAVVVTCSDSRVPPEHIFSAGIGELFVIRNAGNLMGTFDLGSVEYAAEHLGVQLVVVMGHTHCGAVEAALAPGEADGCIHQVLAEVRAAIGDTRNAREAEERNVRHSLRRLRDSELLSRLHAEGKLEFAGAIYDIESGTVRFLEA